MAKNKSERLAPVEESSLAPAAEKRRPDPKPLQRAWGALGAAAGSALLATIVGPMVASASSGFSLDGTGVTENTTTTSGSVEATQAYIYLAPGEVAPEGAPVVQLDPITVVTSPLPGSTVVQVKPKPKVVYIYLKPGEAPPAGAIVQQAGEVATATAAPTAEVTTPTPGAGATPRPERPTPTPGAGATPRPERPTPPPVAPPPPVATPRPVTPPPVAPPPPVATPRPERPTPPPTKPSGG